MSGIATFLEMGGYAFYVWTSYALTAAVLAANVLAPRARHRRAVARLRREHAARAGGGRRSRAPGPR